MKNKNVSITLFLIIALTLSLVTITVFAGDKNMNDDNGKSAAATGKINGKDGCAPPAQSGSLMVHVHSQAELDIINIQLAGMVDPNDGSWWQINSGDWMGGPCCPSNEYDLAESIYPLANQCCNGPDMGPPGSGVPGNHCLCFVLRGYPIPLAADHIFP